MKNSLYLGVFYSLLSAFLISCGGVGETSSQKLFTGDENSSETTPAPVTTPPDSNTPIIVVPAASPQQQAPIATPLVTSVATPVTSPLLTPTVQPVVTTIPIITPIPIVTPIPTVPPTPEPTLQPTPEPTLNPTPEPTSEPTPEPTPEPTIEPTLEPTPTPTLEPTVTPTPGDPLITNMRQYIFGHSLINHEQTTAPPPSNENSVPHWMVQFAQAQGYGYTADGQYGFLRNHTEFPPSPQWSFDLIDQPWRTNWQQSFADVNFTTVLLTPANFVQYKPASEPYDGSNPTNTSPLAETLTLIDWINQQAPNADIYIYENWPHMDGYSGFPLSQSEFNEYHSHTLTTFHSWWQEYHDAIIAARPNLNVRMIPVGPIISTVLTNTELRNLSSGTLYEDAAPHGRPTIYFLAGLITYMATYGVPAPSNFDVPDTVHQDVQTYYDDIVMTIWNALSTYTTANGNSRVW